VGFQTISSTHWSSVSVCIAVHPLITGEDGSNQDKDPDQWDGL